MYNQEQYIRLKEAICNADTILIGAGAGLSTAAGLTYSGERFHRLFGDFEKKYGITDMYTGGFYPFETKEEFWAWWSRHIWYNRYQDAPKATYRNLLQLVKDKDYFVITTNVDHQFQRAGFDKNRLYYMQGDYGLFQCSEPCSQQTWDNEDVIRQMLEQQQVMKIPTSLLPVCPNCGRPLTTNLRVDNRFVEDAGWHQAAERYESFLKKYQGTKLLLLELGVGMNTPVIIKIPFLQMALQEESITYACLNLGDTWVPEEIAEKSICIDDDIDQALQIVTEQ